MAKNLRKRIVDPGSDPGVGGTPEWLDLAALAQVEVSSEDPDHPVEHALLPQYEAGWQASGPGRQTLRICFDEPQTVRRIYLHFVETELTRNQEFTLAWAPTQASSVEVLVRQQWNFSPTGSTHQIEDYRPSPREIEVVELVIVPDVSGGEARATLQQLRLA